jgi:retron-type reverse transcriptase
VETDIASCFEEIPHDRLMQALEDRICDRKLLRLLRAMLRAGVMEQGAVRRSDTGTPQGGVIQTAVKIAIEPIFEADFQPCSFGFRPRRAAHDALQVLIDESWRGNRLLPARPAFIPKAGGEERRPLSIPAVRDRIVLVRTYATDRLALFVAKRHRRARSYGWRAVVYRSPDRYGLINLNGSVVAPRPHRPWREKPNAGGEGRR